MLITLEIASSDPDASRILAHTPYILHEMTASSVALASNFPVPTANALSRLEKINAGNGDFKVALRIFGSVVAAKLEFRSFWSLADGAVCDLINGYSIDDIFSMNLEIFCCSQKQRCPPKIKTKLPEAIG